MALLLKFFCKIGPLKCEYRCIAVRNYPKMSHSTAENNQQCAGILVLNPVEIVERGSMFSTIQAHSPAYLTLQQQTNESKKKQRNNDNAEG